MDFKRLSNLQLDALREIGNIGAGNATTSMSSMLNKRINMHIPSVNVVTFDEMMEIIGGPEQLIVALFFRIQGDAPGSVYFILSIEEAESLVSQLTNGETLNLSSEEGPNPLAISVLKEIGNIMTGSYLSALSDFMNINMQSSIPYLSVDMAAAILTVGLVEISQVSDYAIVIDTEIDKQNQKDGFNGHFFLLPDIESIPKYFTALGINNYE